MVTLTNLRLPATWSTALPQDNNFDISRNELDDFLEAIGDIDWGGTNFLNVGTLNGTPIANFLTSINNEVLGELQDADANASAGNLEGDLLYFDGALWNKFPRGLDGQFLKSSSTGIAWGTGATQINDFSDNLFTVFLNSDANKAFRFDASLITTTLPTLRNYTMPDQDGTVALLADIPAVGSSFDDSAFNVFDVADPVNKKLSFQVGGLTVARTATWPDKDGTVAFLSDITVPGNVFADDLFRVYDNVQGLVNPKQIAFQMDQMVADKTVTVRPLATDDKIYDIPDAVTGDEFVMETFAQTLQNKTLDGTNTVQVASLPATVVLNDQLNTFLGGTKQSVEHDATFAGFRLIPAVGNPATPADGDLWYNSGSNQIFGRINGADVDMGSVTPQDSSFVITCTGETDDLIASAGSPTTTFRMTFPFTLNTGTGLTLGVRASVRDMPVGSDIIVDIKQGGVTILSGLIHIDDGTTESVSSVTQATISTSALTDNALIEVFVTQIGSTTPGKGLKVYLIGSS